MMMTRGAERLGGLDRPEVETAGARAQVSRQPTHSGSVEMIDDTIRALKPCVELLH